jgi:hypothetical protein
MNATTTKPQVGLSQRSPGCMRVTFDYPPLNVMGPQVVLEIREVMNAPRLEPGGPLGYGSQILKFASEIAVVQEEPFDSRLAHRAWRCIRHSLVSFLGGLVTHWEDTWPLWTDR